MNKSGIFSGRTETPLHEEGEVQAKTAGQQLREITIDCIITSPMERALATAKIIATEINFDPTHILQNNLFIERDFGPLEGIEYQPNLEEVEGMESINDLLERSRQGLEYLKSLPYDDILVVSHGSVGRALRHCINPKIPFKPSQGFGNAQLVKLI